MTTAGLLTACGAELVGSGAKPLFSVFLFLMPTMDRTFFRLFFFSFFRKNFLFFSAGFVIIRGIENASTFPDAPLPSQYMMGKKEVLGRPKERQVQFS